MTDTAGSRLPLDRDRLAAADLPRLRIEVVDEAPSTNALVAARARAGEPDGLVVVAEHQTAGRGRLDRTWEAPPRAALMFSVLVRAQVPPERWPWLPLVTGVAVCAGIEAAGGPVCVLKWPNDVLHDGRKLGGILAERIPAPHGHAGVVGVGLNVSQTESELPVRSAASLLTQGHPAFDRTGLLLAVLGELEPRRAHWESRGGPTPVAASGPPLPLPPIEDEYLARMDTLGRTVRVLLPGGASIEGLAVGVSEHGALEVDTPQGRRAVSAGDVVHVRSR
jgi:BirA family transcriptional regulator, biotin operon repressor / biotin---[acetyl-CoA-carboxylase] ligase